MTRSGEGHAPGLVLAIDTAGERCSVGLLETASGRMVASAEPLVGRGHAECLMGILAGTLADAGRTYDDVSRIAVAVGPGSFTGIRVGVSAARGLALALGVPAVGVDTLEALAEPRFADASTILVAQDARRGEIFAGLYARGGTVLSAPAAIARDGVAAFVKDAGPLGPILVLGSAAELAGEGLAGSFPVRVETGPGTPSIAAVARIGAARPAHGARPLYLRAADAKPQVSAGLVSPVPDFQSDAISR